MLKPEDIVSIFEWIELLLISSLKRNLARHKDEEEQEGFTWTAWQAEKIRNINIFREQCETIMDRYKEQIDDETRQLLEEQFEEGLNGAIQETEEARAEENKQSEPVQPTEKTEEPFEAPPEEPKADISVKPPEITVKDEPQWFGVDKTKTEKLINDVLEIEEKAETAAIRTTEDVYRQTVNRVQLAMTTGSISYEKAVDLAVKDFLAQGINCIEYRDGRRVNIADYVRMVLRTTSTRAQLQGKSERFKSMGYDTVLVSQYGMCSKTCLPWQGRVYINDAFMDWSGDTKFVNDIKYGRSQYCGKWFPLLSSAINEGLFHPNCRHGISLYIDGVTDLPEPMDNTEIERRYKEEQHQRELERDVRKAKRKVEGSLDPTDKKKAQADLTEAQKNVKEYIEDTNKKEGELVLVRKPLQEKIYNGDINIGSSADPFTPAPPVPSVSTPGYTSEIDIKAPEVQTVEYTEQKIPERLKSAGVEDEQPNYAKQIALFNSDETPPTANLTEEVIIEELGKSEVGIETINYLKDTEIKPTLNYEPQPHDNRGQQQGNDIVIFMDNIKTPLVAAQTVVHEITHHKYGISDCQWAEAVCMAREKMHKENRTYLTISEKRYIVGLAKKYYGEYNWKKGGKRYGKPL